MNVVNFTLTLTFSGVAAGVCDAICQGLEMQVKTKASSRDSTPVRKGSGMWTVESRCVCLRRAREGSLLVGGLRNQRLANGAEALGLRVGSDRQGWCKIYFGGEGDAWSPHKFGGVVRGKRLQGSQAYFLNTNA